MGEASCLTTRTQGGEATGGALRPPPPGASPLPAVQRTSRHFDEIREYLSRPLGEVSETRRREVVQWCADEAALAEAWLANMRFVDNSDVYV